MISLKGVSQAYHSQVKVLDGIHLDIPKGDFLYVVGGSGAGKSSLLRILATFERPASGRLSLFGYDLADSSEHTVRDIRRSIGFIPQQVDLIPDLTVEENLDLARACSSKGKWQNRSEQLDVIERLGLAPLLKKKAFCLSGGEAQRVLIARALVRAPDLIIADEPTGAQDRDFTWIVMDLLLKANRMGATLVVATHDPEIVRRIRKRCAHLKEGRVNVEEGVWAY